MKNVKFGGIILYLYYKGLDGKLLWVVVEKIFWNLRLDFKYMSRIWIYINGYRGKDYLDFI